MEENVNEALGIKEDAQLTQEAPKEEPSNNGAENTLTTIANIVLVCGILASLICLFTIVWVKNPAYTYHDEYMFNPSGFATTVMILLSTLISWSFMKVLANISLTLKDINKKIR